MEPIKLRLVLRQYILIRQLDRLGCKTIAEKYQGLKLYNKTLPAISKIIQPTPKLLNTSLIEHVFTSDLYSQFSL